MKTMYRISLAVLIGVLPLFAALHKDTRGTQVHTPFRWNVADRTALEALSVTANDTDCMAFQRSDSSIYVLRDNSPKIWIRVAGGDTSWTAPCSLYDGSTFRAAVTGKFMKNGSLMNIDIPTFGNYSVSGGAVTIKSYGMIPAGVSISAFSVPSLVPMAVVPYTGYLDVTQNTTNYLAAGLYAWPYIQITYRYR